MSLIEKIKAWLDEPWGLLSRRQWFESKEMKVYLRKTRHRLGEAPNTKRYECIDLANVEVFASWRMQGIYSKLLDELIAYANSENLALLIENVQLPEQHLMYTKRGFQIVLPQQDETCPSFYKLPS